jgi:hypothetical protein
MLKIVLFSLFVFLPIVGYSQTPTPTTTPRETQLKDTSTSQPSGRGIGVWPIVAFAGVIGAPTYEMFQDKNDVLGWTNCGLWTIGVGTALIDRSYNQSLGLEAKVPLYLGAALSVGYPLVSLVDGYLSNNHGRVETAWIVYGTQCFLGLTMIGDPKPSGKQAELQPLISPEYSGLVWSKTF